MVPNLTQADAATVRRCLGDVVALSTLPAVWAGAKPLRIAESLAAALYSMLGADFVIVVLDEPQGAGLASVAQIGLYQTDPDLAAALKPALLDWVRRCDPHETFLHADPRRDAPIRVTCRQIGHDAELGLIAAGFVNDDAPSPIHHLLLDVSATQATTGLTSALLVAAQAAIAQENARLLQIVQSSNETLEHRVAERTAELMEAHGALRQAQKMEAVGQLTGGIAHDFNNLLMGISGSLELLERGLARGGVDGLARYLQAAQSSTGRAAALTQRLLAFSRRQTLDPKPTDVTKLISGMEDLIRQTIGPAIHLDVVGRPDLWTVLIDGVQLESALLNLAINARDAMPDGGRITIQTANELLDDKDARDGELRPGEYLSICVTDTGAGIPKDIVDRIFDPFFTTKPTGEGTGLGLSMVHGFVRQSGGQVGVRSEVGEGTTIRLYLPRHLGDAGADQAQPIMASESGSGELVLVIDDEPTVRMLIADVLREAGYRLLEAHDGPTGLRILQSDAGVDLLITDVGLPGGMNGRQVADVARVARPRLKVLFVTGFAESAAGNLNLPPGMAVITKPFVLADLSNKVSELIGG